MPVISAAGLARTFQTRRGPVEAVRSVDLTVQKQRLASAHHDEVRASLGEVIAFLKRQARRRRNCFAHQLRWYSATITYGITS